MSGSLLFTTDDVWDTLSNAGSSVSDGPCGTDDRAFRRDTTDELARRETRAVHCVRVVVFFVLIATAAVVCASTFEFTEARESNTFEHAFLDHGSRFVDTFRGNAKTSVSAIDDFAMQITSYARFANSTWPFVTLPDFERRGTATSAIAQVMSIIMVPLVTEEMRDDWESYSVANQGWLSEGLAIRRELDELNQTTKQNIDLMSIPEHIYTVEGIQNEARERGPGPYLPQWQIAPAIPVPGLVNFNLLSHNDYHNSLQALLETQVSIVGRSFDFFDPNDEETARRRDVFKYFLHAWNRDDNGYDDDPVADIYVPLYDDFERQSRRLVGLLTCVIYWKTYFVNILPDSARGITLVLANTCDQQYTYTIHGPNVQYVGPGDLHDVRYDSYQVSTEDGAFLQLDKQTQDVFGSCFYSIHLYPSKEFESQFRTHRPIMYTSVLMFIFLSTLVVFVFYDCLVEKRQRILMDSAASSHAIVSSLFPKEYRDRLYKTGVNNVSNVGGKRSSIHQPHTANEIKELDSNEFDLESKPIADLYEHCTVLFADIVGFTAWSQNREPGDVFVLLEKIYGSFDKIAKKRNVFKVETIGDCYLAVTGLPEPQNDHAVRMCFFASECRRHMTNSLYEQLRVLLGNDIKCLSLRFGLHSGPVTGGILRGDKSRFQLFGDTVNTAARMESTGIRGRIHISQQTRDYLLAAGKDDWCIEREEGVEAKGKGRLQTYWLRIRISSKQESSQSSMNLEELAQEQGALPFIQIDDVMQDEEVSLSEPGDKAEGEVRDEGESSTLGMKHVYADSLDSMDCDFTEDESDKQ